MSIACLDWTKRLVLQGKLFRYIFPNEQEYKYITFYYQFALFLCFKLLTFIRFVNSNVKNVIQKLNDWLERNEMYFFFVKPYMS